MSVRLSNSISSASVNGGTHGGGRPHKVNAKSELLGAPEHDRLFSLIGPNCVAQAVAVVRAFRSLPDSPRQWTKVGVGVATFVKDSKMRSFFIRIYSLSTNTKFFEEEMYQEFDYTAPSWHFHYFTGAAGVCGLSFTDRNEADMFKAVVDNRMEAREQKRREKKEKQEQRQMRSQTMSGMNENRSPLSPKQPTNAPMQNIGSNNIMNKENNGTQGMHVVEVGGRLENGTRSLSMSTNSVNKGGANSGTSLSKLLPGGSKKNKNGADNQKKRALTKEDIGAPTNFRHLEHVGGGQKRNTSYSMNNSNPDNLELLGKMLVSHGICSETELQRPSMQSAISQFISSKASIEEIMKAFAANQHSPGSPNNNALAPMNSPPNNNAESIHRRHSVHSPTSPGAQQQQLGRQSHQNNSNSRFSFNVTNGSSSVNVKPPAPVRRPPPEPTPRRESSAATSVPPYNRSAGSFQRQTGYSPDNNIEVPSRPPLPAGRPVGSPSFPRSFINEATTTPVMSYDGQYPFAPFGGNERTAETTKKAPLPPQPGPHPQPVISGSKTRTPPKTSPRRSSVDRFLPNEQQPQNTTQQSNTSMPSALSRPGSRVAISAPFEEPSASLVKTKSSFFTATTGNENGANQQQKRPTSTTPSTERSPTISKAANLFETKTNDTIKHQQQQQPPPPTANRFNMVSREQTKQNQSQQQATKNVLPKKASAEPQSSAKTAPVPPPPLGPQAHRPTAPPKSSKTKISPPSSARSDKSSAPKPPSEAPKVEPPPPPVPTQVTSVPVPPPPPPVGGPPAPPPPPPPGAMVPPNSKSSGSSTTSATKIVPNEKAKPDDLLAAIRKASVAQLKPAEERKLEPVSNTAADPKSNLLGEIRNFDKSNILKKVETNAHIKEGGGGESQSGANQLPGLLGDLARLVNEQRMAMNPDSAGNSRSGNESDECSDDSFDDDDWD